MGEQGAEGGSCWLTKQLERLQKQLLKICSCVFVCDCSGEPAIYTGSRKGTAKMDEVKEVSLDSELVLQHLNLLLHQCQVEEVRIGEYDALRIVVKDVRSDSRISLRSYYGNWRFVNAGSIVSGYLHSCEDRRKLSAEISAVLVGESLSVTNFSNIDARVYFSKGMFIDFLSVFDDDIVFEVYGEESEEIEFRPLFGFMCRGRDRAIRSIM